MCLLKCHKVLFFDVLMLMGLFFLFNFYVFFCVIFFVRLRNLDLCLKLKLYKEWSFWCYLHWNGGCFQWHQFHSLNTLLEDLVWRAVCIGSLCGVVRRFFFMSLLVSDNKIWLLMLINMILYWILLLNWIRDMPLRLMVLMFIQCHCCCQIQGLWWVIFLLHWLLLQWSM